MENKNKLSKNILDKLNIGPILQNNISELSGGELQRILIAFVMAQEPNILLFDEPFAGIDIGGEETIYQHLKHIVAKKYLTVIMVSHDMSVVFNLANKVICLNKKMICFGSPESVITPANLKKLYGIGAGLYHSH